MKRTNAIHIFISSGMSMVTALIGVLAATGQSYLWIYFTIALIVTVVNLICGPDDKDK